MTMAEPVGRILVVDLDGTLLRGDMLHESFWSAFGRDWRSPWLALAALSRGRAALKRHLAAASDIDVTTLPYDPQVIDYVRNWRRAGGRVALVTASDGQIAAAVAAHLDLFDEVHGSDGQRNLKAEAKAAFLADRYGAGRFVYMGDATADLPVWARAARAVTVNAAPALRRAAERACPETEHLGSGPAGAGAGAGAAALRAYLAALRPHQWLKNLLVFLPMLAAHRFDAAALTASLLAFACFSLVASGVYVVNDLLDLRADRAHPRKRNRPLAAGLIPLAHGAGMAAGLIAAGLGLAVLGGGAFLLAMLAYLGLTTAYSLHLKRRAVIDICVLAGLYTLRIVAGGLAAGIELSAWLLAFSMFFFLSLAAVKRQAELIDSAARGRLTASGRGYQVDDLPLISMVALAAGYLSVLVMALYVNSPAVAALYSRPDAMWGVSAVLLYWITRTAMITHRGRMHDDPVVFAVKDRVSLACFVLVLALVVWAA